MDSETELNWACESFSPFSSSIKKSPNWDIELCQSLLNFYSVLYCWCLHLCAVPFRSFEFFSLFFSILLTKRNPHLTHTPFDQYNFAIGLKEKEKNMQQLMNSYFISVPSGSMVMAKRWSQIHSRNDSHVIDIVKLSYKKKRRNPDTQTARDTYCVCIR